MVGRSALSVKVPAVGIGRRWMGETEMWTFVRVFFEEGEVSCSRSVYRAVRRRLSRLERMAVGLSCDVIADGAANAASVVAGMCGARPSGLEGH